MSAMSTYLENALASHVLRNTAYTTPGTSIYVGLINFYETAKLEAGTLTAVTFPTATANWGMVSGVFIADSSSGTNVLLHGSLTTARDVQDGDVFKFNAGDLDVTFA